MEKKFQSFGVIIKKVVTLLISDDRCTQSRASEEKTEIR